MNFKTSHSTPATIAHTSRWFVFTPDASLLVPDGETIPTYLHIKHLPLEDIQFLGYLDAVPCYTASTDSANEITAIPVKQFYRQQNQWSTVAGTAWHLLNWDKNSRFCGACGTATTRGANERVKVCPACGLRKYPRISPAMIVAVVRDNRILLAHNRLFPGTMYSTLAGFMNPGETFEQCVAREVCEEVGITVHNIRYFGNQPWPFPDSQMIAFTAEYHSGEIAVDGQEIDHADWFTPSSLPDIPPRGSISRRLIDWFINSQTSS